MKILRYQNEQQVPTFGWLHQGKVGAILGSPFDHFRRLEAVVPLERLQLLSPLLPGKLISIQKNYRFQGEDEQDIPDIPAFFLKPPQSIIGSRQFIQIPPQTNEVVAQAELAIVIGKPCHWTALNQALDFVMGYTCALTYFAHDLIELDGYTQYRAYFFDTFTALGPWIETDFDPNDIVISASLNRSLIHMMTSHDMLFSIQQLITYLSSIITLFPGDVILTGPTNPGFQVDVNDLVQVDIEGIGTLLNTVTFEKKSTA